MAELRRIQTKVSKENQKEQERLIQEEIALINSYIIMERGDAWQDLKGKIQSWIEENRNKYELGDVSMDQFLDLRGFVRGLRKVLEEVTLTIEHLADAVEDHKTITSAKTER